ncbi:MAG: 4-hydroxy-tetrahydrodipicolinate synthase [Proteobacteria bacterium]|jgi:4-hydroxy-tetrahydrodipicolinate synthase|nr:4-hydroxy-tetrahydrodipicolinate synthase [Pseudomonadota bacterium]
MKKIRGTITALITPFINGKIDEQSLIQLVKRQLADGVQGFVVHGTTGESPTLTKAEKKSIFDLIKSLVPAHFPLIVGTGTNSTEETVAASIEAEKWGADALLVVVPYYNKPPQRGLFEHFKAVASKVNTPVLLYNVPGRTITALELDTIKKLSEHPNIIGIKEASGNVEFAKQIRQACGQSFTLLSGDDGTYDQFMEAGGDGVISVASHIIPRAFLTRTASRHLSLIDALFLEANPIPVKMAVHLMGLIASPECRLPLVTLADNHTKKLKELMKSEGLL